MSASRAVTVDRQRASGRSRWIVTSVIVFCVLVAGVCFWHWKPAPQPFAFDLTAVESTEDRQFLAELVLDLDAFEEHLSGELQQDSPTVMNREQTAAWEKEVERLCKTFPESIEIGEHGPRVILSRVRKVDPNKRYKTVPDHFRVPTKQERVRLARLSSNINRNRASSAASSIGRESPSDRRWEFWTKRAGETEVATLLNSLGIPPFPEADSEAITEAEFARGREWITALRTAYARDVRPRIEWKKLLDVLDALPVAEYGSTRLLLVPSDSAAASFAAVSGLTARGDFKLEVRFSEGEANSDARRGKIDAAGVLREAPRASLHLVTGIEFQDVVLRYDPDRPEQPEIDWSSTRIAVLPPQFRRFLHRLGLPEEFRVAELELSPPGDRTHFRDDSLTFAVRHPVVPGRRTLTCPLDAAALCTRLHVWRTYRAVGNPSSHADHTLATTARDLLQDAPQIKELFGLPVKIVKQTSEKAAVSPRYTVRLPYPSLGEVPVELSFSASGEMIFGVTLDARRRRNLLRRLGRADPWIAERIHALECGPITCNADGQLRGMLLSSSPESAGEDQSPASWSLEPNGVVRIAIPQARPRRLGNLPPAHEPPPAAGDAPTEAMIASHLSERYAALGEALQIVSLEADGNRNLLRLSLAIGDWPEVSLNPIVVAQDDFADPIADALSGAEVIQAANAEWRTAMTVPMLGTVKLEMLSFDPIDAITTIHCRTHLAGGEIKLPWYERYRRRGRDWERSLRVASSDRWIHVGGNLEAELNRTLRPAVEELEDFTERFLHEHGPVPVRVEVEKDGYGRGRWLRLNPLTVKIKCSLGVPLFNRSKFDVWVSAGQIEVGMDHISLPEEYTVTYRRTFPFSHFALSDPTVTLNLKREEIGIAAKLTPPMVGIAYGALPSDSTDDSLPHDVGEFGVDKPPALPSDSTDDPLLRIDNLWLEVMYLKIEGAGRPAASTLSLAGDLVLLKKHTVSSGRGTIDFEAGTFKADLYVNEVRAPGLPVLQGELFIGKEDGDDTIRLRGEVELTDFGIKYSGRLLIPGEITRIEANNNLSWSRTTETVPFALIGNADLPALGRVSLQGSTDGRFETVTLEGTGEMASTLAWGRGVEWMFRATLGRSESNIQYTYRWYTTDGEWIEKEFPYRSLDDVDEREMLDALQSDLAETGVDPDFKREEIPDAADDAGRGTQIAEYYVKIDGDTAKFYEGSEHDHDPGKTPLTTITRTEYGDNFSLTSNDRIRQAELRFLRDPDGAVHVVVSDPEHRRVWLSKRTDSGPAMNPIPLETPGLGRLLTQMDRIENSKPLMLHGIGWCALLTVKGREPDLVREADGGVRIETGSKAGLNSDQVRFCWITPERKRQSVLLPPGDSRVGNLSTLIGLTGYRASRSEQLLRIAGGPSPRIASLLPSTEPGVDAMLRIWKDGRSRKVPIRAVQLPNRMTLATHLRRFLKELPETDWPSPDEVATDGELFAGPDALCLASSVQLRFLPLGGSSGSGVRTLTAAQVAAWDPETVVHLPRNLKTRVQRKAEWDRRAGRSFAEALVTPWRVTRDLGTWTANPIGPFVSLADSLAAEASSRTRTEPAP